MQVNDYMSYRIVPRFQLSICITSFLFTWTLWYVFPFINVVLLSHRYQEPAMWTTTLKTCILVLVLDVCTGYDLYGCNLPDNPSLSQLFQFQSCVSEVNGISAGEGGRWGRSIRAHPRRKNSDIRIILGVLQAHNFNTDGLRKLQEKTEDINTYHSAVDSSYGDSVPYGSKHIAVSASHRVEKKSTVSHGSDTLWNVLTRLFSSGDVESSGRSVRSVHPRHTDRPQRR